MTRNPQRDLHSTESIAPAGIDDAVAAACESLDSSLAPADAHDAMSADELRTHLADLKRLSGLVTAATARAGAAYLAAGGVKEDGTKTLRGHFRAAGLSKREASTMSQLARGLEDAPGTAAAVADGSLSPDAAVTVCNAVRRGRLGDADVVEQELLAVARDTSPEELKAHVRREEQRRDGTSLRRDEARQRQLRRVAITERADGMFQLNGQLPAEDGARAKTLFESLATWDSEDVPADQKRTAGQRTADAFTDAVDWMLDHRDLPTSAGQSRPHIVVTVPAETVAADLTAADDDVAASPADERWTELPAGTLEWTDRPLSPQAVRRICCDAKVSRVIVDPNGMPLDVGRATRTWSASQRTAITVRDHGCRGPSCDRPAGWTEIHHVRWWRNGGTTNLDNGLLLCRACHRLVHDAGWTVTLDPDDAAATWTSPTDVITVTRPRAPDRSRR